MYTHYMTSFAHVLLQQKEARILWTALYPVHSANTCSNTSILVDCRSMVDPCRKACGTNHCLRTLIMYFLTLWHIGDHPAGTEDALFVQQQ